MRNSRRRATSREICPPSFDSGTNRSGCVGAGVTVELVGAKPYRTPRDTPDLVRHACPRPWPWSTTGFYGLLSGVAIAVWRKQVGGCGDCVGAFISSRQRQGPTPHGQQARISRTDSRHCALPSYLHRIILCQVLNVNPPTQFGQPVYPPGQLDRQDPMPRNSRTSSDR